MITDKMILWDTTYGNINCRLCSIMQKKRISIYQLSRITDLRYEVIERYYDNKVLRYDSNVLAKLCYCLDCDISDLLQYDL